MKPKASTMTDEVREMIALRHSAEQHGNVEPLGRLQWIQTMHGMIMFPVLEAATGEGCGPDLAWADTQKTETDGYHISDALVVLGRWEGFPPLRVNTSKPCPKCRHACDVCDGGGKKLCELCGGQKWTPGKWLPCPGPGCVRDTGGFLEGKIKADCVTCRGGGQIPEQNKCAMCDGSGEIRCTRCIGTGKYSTGRVGGSIDSDLTPKCEACSGSTFVGEWKRQDVKRFANATLTVPKTATAGPKAYLVIGPILEFGIRDPRTSRARIFHSDTDAAGDLLVLLVPRSPQQKPQKAYLVGGVVRERRAVAVGA